MHEAGSGDRLGGFWTDACLVLEYVNRDELEIHVDDFIDAILDRKSFTERERACAKQALCAGEGAAEIPWFAFHILRFGDPSGAELEQGVVIALETDWKQAVVELCKVAKSLPEPISEALAEQIVLKRGQAMRTLGFVEYLRVYRPLLKRCESLLGKSGGQMSRPKD